MTERLALVWESCPPQRAAQRAAPVAVIRAERVIPLPPEEVWTFLADLANHEHLADRYLRLRELSPDGRGARIAIAAPLGIRRTATTRVTVRAAPARFGGTAEVGRRTLAHVQWRIAPDGGGARVALGATVVHAGLMDRVLLAVGGRLWLRRRFRRALARLEAAAA